MNPSRPILRVPFAAGGDAPVPEMLLNAATAFRGEVWKSLSLRPRESRGNEFALTDERVLDLFLDPRSLNFGTLTAARARLEGLRKISSDEFHKMTGSIIAGLFDRLGEFVDPTVQPRDPIHLGRLSPLLTCKWGPKSKTTGGYYQTNPRRYLLLDGTDLVSGLLLFGGLELLQEIATRASPKPPPPEIEIRINRLASQIGFGVPYALQLHVDQTLVVSVVANPFHPRLGVRPGRSVRLREWPQ